MTHDEAFRTALANARANTSLLGAGPHIETIERALDSLCAAPWQALQPRVQPWLLACFGAEIAADRAERIHRFLEEALELVQACGCSASEAYDLVDYVFCRPVGERAQEVGGVMITLAALCLANGIDMHQAGEAELARIWTKVEAIRAKQAAKPKHSPLPAAPVRAAERMADSLFRHIAHGDAAHREWLETQSLAWARAHLAGNDPEQATPPPAQEPSRQGAAPEPILAAIARLRECEFKSGMHRSPEKSDEAEEAAAELQAAIAADRAHTISLLEDRAAFNLNVATKEVARAMSAAPQEQQRQGLTDWEFMRARTILAALWRKYDAAGTSMGRSHEAVLLEAALALLGDPNPQDMEALDADPGELVNATRSYLSARMASRLSGAQPPAEGRAEGGA